jgi:plastocyanin
MQENGGMISTLHLCIMASIFSVLSMVIIFGSNFPSAYAEDVTFIVPGSKDPSLGQFFDPKLQIIEKGQAIVFVNPDSELHHLVIKSTADNKQVFDTGEMKQNQFVSHTFTEDARYTIECTIYPHMKGEILVTDDIATFTKTIPEHNIDVQLSRSPATPKVNEQTNFKVIFIDNETGRNRQHVDYALGFKDLQGEFFDSKSGHTVDGAEYWNFTFDREDAFTPMVEVSGLDFIPIAPVTVEFDTLVTPEFPATVMGVISASLIGALALYSRKR